jgi:hypothetical protein
VNCNYILLSFAHSHKKGLSQFDGLMWYLEYKMWLLEQETWSVYVCACVYYQWNTRQMALHNMIRCQTKTQLTKISINNFQFKTLLYTNKKGQHKQKNESFLKKIIPYCCCLTFLHSVVDFSLFF